MTKQVNANIGHIKCFSCDELAAVRKNRSGGLYYDCLECGRIAPNHAGGQRRIQERAVIWGASGAPADLPAWIREQLPYAVAIRERDRPPAGKPNDPPRAGQPERAGTPTTVSGAAVDDDLPATPAPPRKRPPKTPRENPKEAPPPSVSPVKPERGFVEKTVDDIW